MRNTDSEQQIKESIKRCNVKRSKIKIAIKHNDQRYRVGYLR